MKSLKKTIILPLLLFVLLIAWQSVLYLCMPVDIKKDFSPFQAQKNTAVFAAYTQDGIVSDYVISYLKALKEIAPNIIYITDNPLKRTEIKKLSPYVTHLEASRHGEYDWGSYKRGFNWLKENNYLLQTNKLILANDSALLIAESLKPVLNAMPKGTDLYGITANQDGTYHLQSYFLILGKDLFNHPLFDEYLNTVRAQKDGLTVAYRYEVPFTQFVTDLGYKTAAYIPYEQLKHLPLNDKNCYPLTMLSKYHAPFLKMRTFTNRLNVQEPRRLVFNWLKKNNPKAYSELLSHLKHINSPYLKENRS